MNLVVDNSVVMRWLFNDGSKADKAYAAEVASLVEISDVSVPDLFVVEAANVIARALKNKILREEDGHACFDLISEMGADIVSSRGTDAIKQLTLRAIEDKLSAYDASYLLLAENLACPLATLDLDLRKAAKKRGVTLACID